MAHNNNNLSILFIFILFTGCSSIDEKYLSFINNQFEEQKRTFEEDLVVSKLFDHFPESIDDTSAYFLTAPPTCPPSYDCINHQRGFIYLRTKRKENSILSSRYEFIYKTYYQRDSLIIINQNILAEGIFPVEKCNKAYPEAYPIPYFEHYKFDLGYQDEKKAVGEHTYYNTKYITPVDLEVYVVDAKAGDFWKVNCNEKRPESLKEWKHGYSRGIATSEKENIIVYWTMIW